MSYVDPSFATQLPAERSARLRMAARPWRRSARRAARESEAAVRAT